MICAEFPKALAEFMRAEDLTPAEIECGLREFIIDGPLAETIEYMRTEAHAGYSVCLTPAEVRQLLAWIGETQQQGKVS